MIFTTKILNIFILKIQKKQNMVLFVVDRIKKIDEIKWIPTTFGSRCGSAFVCVIVVIHSRGSIWQSKDRKVKIFLIYSIIITLKFNKLYEQS